MIILEDTRQQAYKHNLKHMWFAHNGVEVIRTKLLVGDYMLYGGNVAIDTKANIEEIANNIGGAEHVRFREECKLAQRVGAQLIILIENNNGYKCVDDVMAWVNPNPNKTARSIEGPRLVRAMKTMSERYGVRFQFCTPGESGRQIVELLGGEHEQSNT